MFGLTKTSCVLSLDVQPSSGFTIRYIRVDCVISVRSGFRTMTTAGSSIYKSPNCFARTSSGTIINLQGTVTS